MKRRIICILLAAFLLVTATVLPQEKALAINSVSKTDDEIITAAMTYLNIKEGNCNSVNANDNGAVSIGMIQWHGTRALNIIKQVVALIPDYALEVLGEDFYQEILTATNWETRIVNAEEKAALVLLLSTEESKQVQIAQARDDLGGYFSHARRQGMETPALQLYFMDIENQYGSGGAERMVKYAKEASGLSQFKNLTQFHNGMRKAAYQLEYNNSVTPYISRRESTYTYIVETLAWETDVPYCVMTARNGAEGDTHVSFEVTANGTFTFPENPYTNPGYEFVGWNMHRMPENTWYIANIGWCTPGWIEKQGYVKCLYQPGQTQAVDSKFLSSSIPGSAYLLVPVWKASVVDGLPTCSNGCTHSWSVTGRTEATCVSGAYVSYICAKCKLNERVDTALPNGHSYGEWQTLQAVTCTADGLRSRTCSVCKLTQTETVPATGHQTTKTAQLLAPTCTAEGQAAVVCSACGEVIELQTVPAKGHTPGETVTDLAPTCTTAGLEHAGCTSCNMVIYAKQLPAQHSFSDWVIFTPATEEGDGVRTRTCAVCNFIEIQKIPCAAHTHTYTKTAVAPTCETEGYDLFTCDCGENYTVTTAPALGHDTVDIVAKATCCSAGFTVSTCSRCGSTKLCNETPALGHSWDAGKITKLATADLEGEKTVSCTRCGFEQTQTIPATGSCPGGIACPGSHFADMPMNWAHAGLDFCIERGLLSGTSAVTLSPNSKMSRAMLVTVLYAMEGKPAVNSGVTYTDIPKGSWYETAVQWATACELVSGTGNQKFSPTGIVTREQIAAILYRYAVYKGYDFSAEAKLSDYPDYPKISLFARAGMKWAVGVSIISGKPSGGKTYLDPLGGATRAEVAAILMSLLQKVN